MKRYICTTEGRYSTAVKIDGKYSSVNFTIAIKGQKATFTTNDEKIQSALESHRDFKKQFVLVENKKENEDDISIRPPGSDEQLTVSKEFPEAQTIQDVAEILREDPFKVDGRSLSGKDKILNKAKELGLSFPNLVID